MNLPQWCVLIVNAQHWLDSARLVYLFIPLLPPDFNGPLSESLMDPLKLSGAENNICVHVKIAKTKQPARFHLLIMVYIHVKCRSSCKNRQ